MRAPVLLAFALSSLASAVTARPAHPAPAPDSIRLDLPEGGVALPLSLQGDRPVVEVRLSGEGPFQFLIDTGAAGGGRISAALARRFGLQQVGEVPEGDPGGLDREARPLVVVTRLEIGGATARDVPLLLAGDDMETERLDGILGFALFRNVLLTLDYPALTLRLDSGSLPEPDGARILASTSEHGVPAVKVQVAGRPLEADIGSGSRGWLLVPESFARTLPLAGERVAGRVRASFGEFEIRQADLDGELRIGSHVLDRPALEFAGIFPRANLGSRLLRDFALTFDAAHGRVRFERAAEAPFARPQRYRIGATFAIGPDGPRVDGTTPGSPAERAGLRPGDVLLAVDGSAVAALGAGGLRDALSGAAEKKLEVRRGAETLTLTVVPEQAD